MDRQACLIFLILLSKLGDNSLSCGATLNPFPLGTIGCLVSDVCGNGEICTNDLLFGSCQSIFSRALSGGSRYELRTREIERLEEEIQHLIKAGFTWKDAYTQCILQNTLLEFSHGRMFNRKLCETALASAEWTEDVSNEIARVLHRLESGDRETADVPEMEAERDIDLLNSNKRDEIVQVHKYFDRSTGQLKRDPFFEDSNYYDPDISQSPYSYYYTENSLPAEFKNKNYYQLYENPEGSSYMPDSYSKSDLSQTNSLMPLLINAGRDEYKPSVDNEDNPNNEDNEGNPSIKTVIENLVLTPRDEQALEGLLEGTISPKDLDVAQQRRLQIFIKGLIQVLDSSSRNMEFRDETEEDNPLSDAASLDDLQPSVPSQGVERESPPLDYDVYTDQLHLNDASNAQQNVPKVALGKLDLLLDKKTVDESEEKGDADPNSEDVRYIYLKLSKELDATASEQFVRNLSQILNLPEGLLRLNKVGPDRLINLEVRTDPDGKWDAVKIAKETQDANDKIKKVTGIAVELAGAQRDENLVEVKQDNRYVVLTFILVSTIAGVVLAVVAIYLYKRHNRSKQKLAQIANNGDSNEASKDYQDLCRQRMQGKSSEKPEPLHAASRIGSVSETQVRSPSSRSSTSSWSEEPAATNMDISTGHIVLSYMEDHLKNQDRLDCEWEAVSSYVADPSSTKVATDQSNMRKNRFADILPYDHSRVILSSNANVSNSDYINANFITDHDPRNPAYITTQGPLPHTVADFWQMIWEQGSVVIVMLTRLVENGATLCHRYWPEEGSDLYHIYEVHLVSEHIWCDDYLVRSFYLKNLQTNETRTVTQFHFLTWPELSVPASIKALLDFRRKVNKSFRGRSCPIVVHCSDGCGRAGTYCLIDMVLNKMAKGAKEIDMAATLEHIRDQRMSMVKTKEQFQFSLAAVAEEVHAILKALPQ